MGRGHAHPVSSDPDGSCSPAVVKKFSDEVVAPKVAEMDENEKMDPAIIKGLFEQGVSRARPSPTPVRC